MKLQSIESALPSDQALGGLQEASEAEDSKLGWRHCVAAALQVTASLGACGVLHWAVS